jgi:mRNA interferase YafQ
MFITKAIRISSCGNGRGYLFDDRNLAAEWADHRECSLRPDLLLVYRKPNPETLRLVRLGSHGEPFGSTPRAEATRESS